METYHQLWRQNKDRLNWNCLFVLPFWLDTVCRCLGTEGEPTILTAREGSDLIGAAPLAQKDGRAFFLGNPEVCDYQDIVTAPGKEDQVMQAMIRYLGDMNIRELELCALRPDAAALAALEAPRSKWTVQKLDDGVSYEAGLPETWDGYLYQLNSKQRHEVRRKMRRLSTQAEFTYQMAPLDSSVDQSAKQFIQLFQKNRADKAQFMGPAMAVYFKELIQVLAQQQMLRLYFLDLNHQPAAAVLCFDYNQVRYLYNSGYDAQYQKLSVGILSKVFSIQKAIEANCRGYDFLRGAEVYKKRTGGRPVPLYRCRMSW